MILQAALQSDIFLRYVLLIIAVLVIAGLVLLILTFILRKDVRPIWLTYRSWLVMAPLIVGFVLAGRIAVIAGVTLLSIFGFKEFARATGLYRDWWMTGSVYLAILAVGATSLIPNPYQPVPGWFGMFMALPVFSISLFVLVPIVRNQTQGQLQGVALAILGFLYVGWMFGHLGFLANSDNPYGYLMYVLLATELNDVAAFTFGRLFGRRPLRSGISPRKTWEGAMGALLVSMILPWALWFSFPHFQPVHLVLTGLIVGVGGQLGDLAISVIKRDIGVKDLGAAIPGHGGVLDRIDSLIFVAPFFLHMVEYFQDLR